MHQNVKRKKIPKQMGRGRMGHSLRRCLAFFLCLGLLIPYSSNVLHALAKDATGLCEHHPVHTKDCGYVKAASHIHDENCYETHCLFQSSFPAEDEAEMPSIDTPSSAPAEQTDPDSAESAEQPDSSASSEPEETSLPDKPDEPEEPSSDPHVCTVESGCKVLTCDLPQENPGHPCEFVCEICNQVVTLWQWVDDDEILVQDEQTRIWGLGLPGASADNPLTAEMLDTLLPAQIRAELADGTEKILNLTWDYSPLPDSPFWQGSYTLTARLPKGYTLEEGIPALSVLLDLGGADLYAAYPGTRRPLTASDSLADHTVEGIQPPDTTVNLFDYSTGRFLDYPTSENDVMPKSNNVAIPSTWNFGINAGRLLLFGDSMAGGGYWNNGCGAGRGWGKTHTNMKGIVESILGANGYPVINLRNARNTLLNESGAWNNSDLPWGLAWAEEYDVSLNAHDTTLNPAIVAKRQSAPALSIGVLANAGFTVAADGTVTGSGNTSLAYLFDPKQTDYYKKTYTDVTGLFQLDQDGYYYYYARQNFAELNTDGGNNYFTLYDGPAVWRTDGGYDGNGHFDGDMSLGNFFPFDRASKVFDSIQTADKNGNPTNILSSSEALSNAGNAIKANHHMGMTVEIDFRQPVNGLITNGVGGSVPMSFEFSGDDDVWVFIDDVLVLDIGGIHSELYGTIDFSTGDVYIGQSWRTGGEIDKTNQNKVSVIGDVSTESVDYTTLKDLFTAAGAADDHAWKGNTFASNSDHTLKMFYLERGNYDSSLALRFNLQPRLYHQIKKVDQNGEPLQGITFDLYAATATNAADPEGIRCANATSSTADAPVYIKQSGDAVLATLTTDGDGLAQFTEMDEKGQLRPFNFADRYEGGNSGQYYLLKERSAPAGYRELPIDVVLEYEPASTMLIVANRWTTGSYASFTSTVNGNDQITYGVIDPDDGKITESNTNVAKAIRKNGLVVAIPSMEVSGTWLALYGSNINGFSASHPEKIGGAYNQDDLRKAVLKAVLYQAYEHDIFTTPSWYLDWNDSIGRLEGTLSDLPGRADRYQLDSDDGDMRMMYGIIMPETLAQLNINETTAEKRYQALGNYVQALVAAGSSPEDAVSQAADTILAVPTSAANGKGFSFLNIDQFNRVLRSLIYIPNEQRELRIQKVDQDGKAVNGAMFSLYATKEDAQAGQNPVSTGVTAHVEGQDGVLIFKPQPRMNGSAVANGYAKIEWASLPDTTYYLREVQSPSGHRINDTIIPVIVGIYSIYADAGAPDDGVTVMAGVGKLAQTMIKYASNGDVNISLRDITSYCQTQPSGDFDLYGWEDALLENASVVRSLNLHYKMNALVDYGLHDIDGGQTILPFFVTDTGFIRARVQQNWAALDENHPTYDSAQLNRAQKDNLGDTDITSLFSLLNVVVVTDQTVPDTETGSLTVSKHLTGTGLMEEDYTKNFQFKITLTKPDGSPLTGRYYFYGTNKSGYMENGQEFPLHHDESITILGLPAGTKYTVEEIGSNQNGWYVFPKSGTVSGTISSHHIEVAAFQNSKQPFPSVGGLTLSKTVIGSGAGTEKQFRFTIVLENADGAPLSGAFPYTGSQSGVISSGEAVLLRHNESITISGLPAGTNYRVTESDSGGYTVIPSGDVGQILDGEIADATFVNHQESSTEDGKGNLIVRKTISGSKSDPSDVFHFTITLSPACTGTFGDLAFTGGKASFTLKGGESIFIRNLPAGTSYTVTETDADQNGYQTSADKATGTIPSGGTVTASFRNHKGPEEDPERPSSRRIPGTGDLSQPEFWAALGLCAAAGACVMSCTKQKKP